MAVLLAALSSISIGTGEFLAGTIVRRVRTAELVAAYFLIGIVCALAAVPLVASRFDGGDFAYGGASGLLNGLALFALYKGYESSTLGLVAPIAAMVMAMVPVGWDLAILGADVTTLTGVGFVVGVVAIGLASYPGGSGAPSWRGIGFAVVSGVFYGAAFVCLGETDVTSGLWPAVPQRGVAFVTVAAIARLTGPRALPEATALPRAFLVGALGSIGLIAYVAAVQRGSLAAVSVIGSQFAAVAVFLTWAIGRESLRWWQTLGVVGTAVAVGCIAVG